MRDQYEKQLNTLNQYMTEMGRGIIEAINEAIRALMNQDAESARKNIGHDREVDHLEREIENLCLKLLLSQQPVATDLRMVSAALKMVTDMERIGDHAADISEITILLTEAGYPSDLSMVKEMADEAVFMVKESIEAYVERDAQRAADVIRHDDVVDQYFIDIKKKIIRAINENIQNGEQAADVLMIVKYLERIGDHATNLAEWILFYITGEHPEVTV